MQHKEITLTRRSLSCPLPHLVRLRVNKPLLLFVTRLDILGRQSDKQTEDLIYLIEEKGSLQERMEMLAEKYEDTKDRQELILKRFVIFSRCYTVVTPGSH
jgi:hypothetical protein